MSRINKLGQHIRLPDGREATTVFNGLIGVGIKWGIHHPREEDFELTDGGCFNRNNVPDDWPWQPDAFLREAEFAVRLGEECVGEEYEFIEEAADET